MQIRSRSSSMALVLLMLAGSVNFADAYSLRQPFQPLDSFGSKVHKDVSYKVVKTTSIERGDASDSGCKLGSFLCWVQDFLHGAGWLGHAEDSKKQYELSGSACQTIRVTVISTASVKVTEKITKMSEASATATATASEKATAKNGTHSASATKKATAEGQAKANAEGTGEASAEANATKQGSAEDKACVSVAEVKEHLKLKNDQRVGEELSAQIVLTGDELAFSKAYDKVLQAARKAGLLNAEEAAKALAAAKAKELAALEAKAAADKAAAKKAEAGATKDAQDKSKAEALAKARDAAKKAALKAAAAAKKAADGSKEDKAAAEAAAKAAAEAKAAQDNLEDIMNPKPTQVPARPTEPAPTNPPRKVTPEQIAAKLP